MVSCSNRRSHQTALIAYQPSHVLEVVVTSYSGVCI